MEGSERLHAPISPCGSEPPQFGGDGGSSGEGRVCDSPVRWDEEAEAVRSSEVEQHIFEKETKNPPIKNDMAGNLDTATNEYSSGATKDVAMRESGRYFYYDSPLREQTGIWVPVSVPPMTEHDHEEWHRGFGSNGGYFPEEEYKWELDEENKEMTMWDVFSEMVVAAKDKVISLASYDLGRCGMSVVSNFFLQEAWKDMAQTLADANVGFANELLEVEPTKWLPDSAATACMLCGVHFHPIMCSRHHCRFCGGLFCGGCSKGRSLMPPKFRTSEPQRVCDVCGVRLESIQPYLMNQVSHASQLPTHDLTDLSTLRSWLNIPWAHTMEQEIYKAANSIRSYCKVPLWVVLSMEAWYQLETQKMPGFMAVQSRHLISFSVPCQGHLQLPLSTKLYPNCLTRLKSNHLILGH